jgi:hypothetical protein
MSPADLRPRASVFDFDCTLADMVPFFGLFPAPHLMAVRDLPAWDAYHDATAQAAPIDWVLALARIEARSGHVVVVTARDERWRAVTEAWLAAHPIPHTELLMRAAGDQRHDAVVKADILTDLRTRFDVRLAVDDRPSVVDFWRASGVPTVHVPGWPAESELR